MEEEGKTLFAAKAVEWWLRKNGVPLGSSEGQRLLQEQSALSMPERPFDYDDPMLSVHYAMVKATNGYKTRPVRIRLSPRANVAVVRAIWDLRPGEDIEDPMSVWGVLAVEDPALVEGCAVDIVPAPCRCAECVMMGKVAK